MISFFRLLLVSFASMSTVDYSISPKAESLLRRLPGILAWTILVAIALISFYTPEIVAYILLLYALYWVFRAIAHTSRLLICFFHIQKDTRTNWLKRCHRLELDADKRLDVLQKRIDLWWNNLGIHKYKHAWIEQYHKSLLLPYIFMRKQAEFVAYYKDREELKAIKKYLLSNRRPNFSQVQHVIIVPTYKEGWSVLEPTFTHLLAVNFPLKRIHVILATEAADQQAPQMAQKIKHFCQGSKINLHISKHQLKPGEVVGKSANEAYAIKWFTKQFIEPGLVSPEHLLVTSLDADYRVHP
ncbi:MAG TPA: hypothetical protein ENN77_02140, partial [Candidatus Wirthbacteria bacterium]|nr:hypothetical protein [Candidatus Wirthbacteria bacterium]